MDDLRYAIEQVPPFTRTTLGLLGTVTISSLLQLISPYSYAYLPAKIAKNWEIHRLILSFFFGGGGIAVIFNTIMLYRSLKDLETSHFRGRLADMTWAFVLMCGGIIGLNTPLMTPILFQPFLMAVTHLWGQTNPSGRVSLYGLLTIPAPYFSLALLGMDLLNGGTPAVLVSLTGMASAHAYYYLSVVYANKYPSSTLPRQILRPPQFLINLLGNGAGVAPSSSGPGAPSTSSGSTTASGGYSTGFGTAYRPAGSAAAAAAAARRGGGGATTTATEERQASHKWGRGTRLGGE
ncbi:hypothetical protein JCM3766R1_002206 [Sporobolomyces carnicolor]